MFIRDIPDEARARLVLIAEDGKLIDAAKLLISGTDIVVVRDSEGTAKGVVTKTDIVRRMSVCQGAACQCPVSTVMSRTVVRCCEDDLLQDVLLTMQTRRLKNIVLVDPHDRPLGLLTQRAVLRVLLGESRHEEDQLVDYVSGVGYR